MESARWESTENTAADDGQLSREANTGVAESAASASMPASGSAAHAVPDPLGEASSSSSMPDGVMKWHPPPAVELHYSVEASIKRQVTQGYGRISWLHSGNAYTAKGEAGVLFISVLEFSSEGTFGPGGIAPELYREKRFRKPVTNTWFDHDANRISFSASPLTLERSGMEQDRASVIWQLAGIGRANPDAFHAGKQLILPVAAARKSEQWTVKVIGLESLLIGDQMISSWHLQREPLPGSDDQRIDFWFAPEIEWYPVRLRYSETNGDWLDLSLAKVPHIGVPQGASFGAP